jgi:hypothetical protein
MDPLANLRVSLSQNRQMNNKTRVVILEFLEFGYVEYTVWGLGSRRVGGS